MDVVLVSPRRIIRKGLCTLLAQKNSIRVVADVDNAVESYEIVRRAKPEVLLVDSMNAAADLENLGRVRKLFPDLRVLLLIESPNEDFELHAIKAGARGCLPKEADPQALEKALHAVGRGEIWASHHLATRLIERFAQSPEDDDREADGLTEREWQVLAFVAQGYRNKEIADRLSVAENTVKTHLAAIYKKLRVTTRLEAALQFFHDARRNGHSPSVPLQRPSQKHYPARRSRTS